MRSANGCEFQKRHVYRIWIGFLLLLLLTSGCVRMTGGAGYWKQGPDDAEPQSKYAGFDTQKMIPQDKSQGSIQT